MKVVSGRWLRVVLTMMGLLSVVACTKSDDAWDTAVQIDTPDAYTTFLERHPKSEHAEQARTRRDALIDERDWNTARRANTAESYDKYLVAHPDGVWSELASRRRNALNPVRAAAAPLAPPTATPTATPNSSSAALAELKPPKRSAQLGAFSSPVAARKGWNRLQRSFPELADRSPLIDAQPLKGSSLYRLLVQLDSDEEADILCAALIRGGAACIKLN